MINVTSTKVPDLLLLEPEVFGDARGFFIETWNRKTFREVTGVDAEFVQDNHSRSANNVLRGLHYQVQQPQGKLVRVIHGEVFDVAVDLRRSSKTFGCWDGVRLSSENHAMLWVPPGFAHGFYVLSKTADLFYKCTDYYAPVHERTIIWNDPVLNIQWPLVTDLLPILSAKDVQGKTFKDAEYYA